MKEKNIDNILVKTFMDSKGDSSLFNEFLSINMKEYFDVDSIDIKIEKLENNIWNINLISENLSENIKVDMDEIKIPKKYLLQ